jgi:hypothetical protein
MSSSELYQLSAALIPRQTRALQPTPKGSKLGGAKDRRFKANQIIRILEVWLVLTKKHEVFAHVGED